MIRGGPKREVQLSLDPGRGELVGLSVSVFESADSSW